MKNMEIEDNI